MRRPLGVPARLAMGMVRLYQRMVSPFLPPVCRFRPTCSQYAAEAVSRYGLCRGAWLAARRLLRCGPWHPGGYDPVPGAGPKVGGSRCGSG